MASFMDNSIDIATQDEEVYQNILKRYEPACLVPKKPATLGKCLKVEPTALGRLLLLINIFWRTTPGTPHNPPTGGNVGTTNRVTLINQYQEELYFLARIGTTMSFTLTGNQTFFRDQIMASSMDSSIDIDTQDEEVYQNILKRYEPACLIPKKPAPLGTFLNRESAALGAAQIVIGLIIIGLGIVLVMCPPSLVIIIKLPFLTGFLFLVCGSLSAAVEKYPKILWVCLKMSLGSSLSAGIGIVLYCVDMFFWNSYSNEDQLSFMTAVIKGLLINLTVLEIYTTLPLIIKGDK